MAKSNFSLSIHDDKENDWLAKELRKENFHGCRGHDGEHKQSSADNHGWATRTAKMEGYNACRTHDGQHATQESGSKDVS